MRGWVTLPMDTTFSRAPLAAQPSRSGQACITVMKRIDYLRSDQDDEAGCAYLVLQRQLPFRKYLDWEVQMHRLSSFDDGQLRPTQVLEVECISCRGFQTSCRLGVWVVEF